MSVRLSMLDSGIAKPHPMVAAATRLLVVRLGALSPDEAIEIACTQKPLHAKYIRQSTGEVLAELQLSNET